MEKFIWQHRVAIIDQCCVPYEPVVDTKKLAAPVLDTYIASYEQVSGKKFALKDREPKRVGVLLPADLQFRDQSLPCCKVNWAQSHVRSRVSLDMLPPEERFCRLAVDCLLRTGDDFILTKRSQKVSEYKGYWDVSAAGWVDLGQLLDTGNLEDQVVRELHEEVGLEKYSIVRINQLGLCINPMPEYSMVEVCFEAETKLGVDMILHLSKGAIDGWEGKHRAFKKSELISTLNNELFKPAGAATVMLALSR